MGGTNRPDLARSHSMGGAAVRRRRGTTRLVTSVPAGRVLDTAAVIDIASGRSQYGQATVAFALNSGMTLVVPSLALAEAWSTVPASGYPFLEALRELAVVWVEPLTATDAQPLGLLAGGRPDVPVNGTAQAVMIARARGLVVLTGDFGSVVAVDPKIGFESLP